MITLAEFMGGATELSSGTNFSIRIGELRRVRRVTATAASLVGTLEDINGAHIRHGALMLALINEGANTWTLVDSNGQGISQTVAQNQVAMLSTYLASGVRKWLVDLRSWQ